MSYLKKTFTVLVISVLFCSCSKEEEKVISSLSSAKAACVSINTQDTIYHNSINYIMVANSGVNNSIGIEVVNTSGVFTSNYSMEFLQVHNSSVCDENNVSTELTANMGKFFEFQNLPAWSIDTNTIAKIHIKLDGISYYLQDLNLDR